MPLRASERGAGGTMTPGPIKRPWASGGPSWGPCASEGPGAKLGFCKEGLFWKLAITVSELDPNFYQS